MAEQVKRQRDRPRNPFRDVNANTLQSLDRALSLLKALSLSRSSTLTDLAIIMGVAGTNSAPYSGDFAGSWVC